MIQILDQYKSRCCKTRHRLKACVEKGWIGEYRWGFSEEDLALSIGYKGPCVVGTSWLEGMSEPDLNGLIHATGESLGGHCYLINGYSVKTGLYRIINSWGTSFGINGECFIHQDDMKKLLKDDGECVIPVQRLKG